MSKKQKSLIHLIIGNTSTEEKTEYSGFITVLLFNQDRQLLELQNSEYTGSSTGEVIKKALEAVREHSHDDVTIRIFGSEG